MTEVEGPGFKGPRPFLLTLFDPFDVWGLISKRGKQERYWETDGVSGSSIQNVGANKSDATYTA